MSRGGWGSEFCWRGTQPHLAQGRIMRNRHGSMSKCLSDNLQVWDEKTLVNVFLSPRASKLAATPCRQEEVEWIRELGC